MPKKLKSLLDTITRLSIKNHWLLLVLIISFQYLSGKALSEPDELFFSISANNYLLLRSLHELVGKIILLLALGLTIEKLYLWLRAKGKI